MREVLPELLAWWRAGEGTTMATVVSTFRSAPRPAGSSMLRGPDDSAVGSISGGCVEAAAHQECGLVRSTGHPSLTRYGVADGDAWAIGLTCGGELDVFTQEINRANFPHLGEVAADIEAGRAVAVATVIEHPEATMVGRRLILRPGRSSQGGLVSARLDAAVHDDALGILATGVDATLSYGPDGERLGSGTRVFVHAFAPRPRMVLFGAIDFAAAMSTIGGFLGYHVTVCDARSLFATPARFPDADEVVVDWPHRYLAAEDAAGRIDARTVLVVLTHDPKFDVPLLTGALRLPVAYVGAMGSRRTHDQRLQALVEAGVSREDLDRLHSPIGLDLGARTPQSTALSIAAEIVAHQWGGSGAPLRSTQGPIHHHGAVLAEPTA